MNHVQSKIINDPVFGLIEIHTPFFLELISHPLFQRLNRIKQLGLSFLVYPGASHNRFEHSIGAFHLLKQSISTLRLKGIEIDPLEEEATLCAILLHDLGHGPFSHTLEGVLLQNICHENISLLYMEQLNQEFNGRLSLAIDIFTGKYHKIFLSELVSSQIDVDRLDYLCRDSFFTGVAEGVISADRIIKMLHVIDNHLVIESKGIYSVEKFLIARRLMYWQVYLHKTVIAAEMLLIQAITRAQELISHGVDLFASPSLLAFLKHKPTINDFKDKKKINGHTYLEHFALLDDSDLIGAMKVWQFHEDRILAILSSAIVHRKLNKVELSPDPIEEKKVDRVRKQTETELRLNTEEINYFVKSGTAQNNAYPLHSHKIKILMKDGSTEDLQKASDIDLEGLSKTVKKYYLTYPKSKN